MKYQKQKKKNVRSGKDSVEDFGAITGGAGGLDGIFEEEDSVYQAGIFSEQLVTLWDAIYRISSPKNCANDWSRYTYENCVPATKRSAHHQHTNENSHQDSENNVSGLYHTPHASGP